MKLIEALSILQRPPRPGAAPFSVHLSCGFTPLDLKSLLGAHLRLRLSDAPVEIATGLFGDLAGDLERLDPARHQAVAVVIEWSDLDSRLGIRTAGGWRVSALDDITQSARRSLDRVLAAVTRIAAAVPVALSFPTLPLPPVSYMPRAAADHLQLTLRAMVAQASIDAASIPGCRVLSAERLAILSPPASRLDARAELAAGFPYQGPHASAVAELLSLLLAPPAPKKGLITDLDDTLWNGIVGEIGIEGICWTLDRHAPLHGLYQQFLQSLADAGVLIGVASKNDPAVAESALNHPELLITRAALMPVEASWGRKSEAVARILQRWNIAPDAVVFLDDSAMECAEVHEAFPAMDCRLFPKKDPAAFWQLLGELRDLFGRFALSEEDRIRSASLAAPPVEIRSAEDFLRDAQPVLSIAFSAPPEDSRPLELINKTNQFNLNGRRLAEADWRRLLAGPESLVMVLGYSDRFGPLGRIAVLAGERNGTRVTVSHWVMSCRAFSRRIEHACLAQVFEKTGASEICFAYEPTPRNGPLQEFFQQLAGETPAAEFVLSHQRFREVCPAMVHRVEII